MRSTLAILGFALLTALCSAPTTQAAVEVAAPPAVACTTEFTLDSLPPTTAFASRQLPPTLAFANAEARDTGDFADDSSGPTGAFTDATLDYAAALLRAQYLPGTETYAGAAIVYTFDEAPLVLDWSLDTAGNSLVYSLATAGNSLEYVGDETPVATAYANCLA